MNTDDWSNVISTANHGDGVYIDYIDTGTRYSTDEELLEKMDIETIERFLRKKKLKNIEKK